MQRETKKAKCKNLLAKVFFLQKKNFKMTQQQHLEREVRG